MTKYQNIALLMSALAIAFVMAACGGDEEPETTAAPTATATIAPLASGFETPSPEPEEMDDEAMDDEKMAMFTGEKFGGVFKIVGSGGLKSFDPLWTTASGTGQVADTILEGLIGIRVDYGKGPQTVDKWEASDDLLTWTMTIRDGLTFHDGVPLTSADVVGTLNRQRNRGVALRLVWGEFGPEEFSDFIKTGDDTTFTMHLDSPTVFAMDSISNQQGFAPLVVHKAWQETPVEESGAGKPVGHGPFMFKSWTPGAGWTAERFVDYVPSTHATDGTSGAQIAYFEEVQWQQIDDQTTRVAAMQVGEVDYVQEFPAELLDRLRRDEGIQFIDNPPARLIGHFNHTLPPFNNREARQAFVMAYENEKALQLATGDDAFWRLCPSLIRCGTTWESTAGSEGRYHARDYEGAIQKLKDAGLYGHKVVLTDPTDRQPAHAAATVSREVLEDLGFDVDFQVMDWATQSAVRADPDLWNIFHTWGGSGTPLSAMTYSEYQYEGYVNLYQDTTGTQREIFGRWVRATEEEELRSIVEEFQAFLYEDAIMLIVGEFFSQQAASSAVGGLYSGPGGNKPANKYFKN